MLGILRTATGNATSVQRALMRLNIPSTFVDEPGQLSQVDALIFPGAGAAQAGMRDLRERNFVETLRDFRKPFLGLCLGMQLLFDFSEEGQTECLGIIPGSVRSLPSTVIKPHMGWNRLHTGEFVYFVHGFVCVPEDPRVTTMTVQYGEEFCAAVRLKNFFGLQWHPEKSGAPGDRFLCAFSRFAERSSLQSWK